MKNTNKVLLLAQILLLLGSLTLFYKFVDYYDLKHKQEVANLTFSSLENEYLRLIYNSRDITESWAKDIKRKGLKPEDFCKSGIVDVLDHNDLYSNYGAGDTKGNPVCSKIPYVKGYNINSSSPKYQEIIDQKEFEVTSFGYSATTKEPRVGIGYPLTDSNGEVTHVLFVSLNLVSVNKFVEKLSLPNNSELFITDPEGKIEVTYPLNQDLIGKQKFSATIYSLILSQKNGQIRVREEDGRNMVYTYAPFVLSSAVDDDNIGFLVYGIERDKNVIKVPDIFTITQLIMMITSLSLLTYVVIKINKKGKK